MGGRLDAAQIAATDPDEFAVIFKGPPALHRFPGSMGKRTQDLCQFLVDHYGGDAAAVWAGVDDGRELVRRVRALPGFGGEKSKIFSALLAKRFGVRPPGWEEATAPFSDDEPRSVADIDSAESLQPCPRLEEDDEGSEEGQGRHAVAPDASRRRTPADARARSAVQGVALAVEPAEEDRDRAGDRGAGRGRRR